MARLTLDEVLESIFDSDDDSDDVGHLDSESKEEEDEGGRRKEFLAILASSSSAWRSWQRLAKLFLLSL